MQFCDSCGTTMIKTDDEWVCKSCDPDEIPESTTSGKPNTPPQRSASVEDLPTTSSGSIKKRDAMKWINSLSEPSDRELQNAFLPKPADFSGSTFPTSISNIRVTGDPKFVETVAGLLQPITELDHGNTRVQINLKETEDRETGETTGNYALYLSIAQRA